VSAFIIQGLKATERRNIRSGPMRGQTKETTVTRSPTVWFVEGAPRGGLFASGAGSVFPALSWIH
jgi:hypothetical protein